MTRQAIDRGAETRAVARVVDAVLFRGSPRPRRLGPPARAGKAGAGADALRQRPDRQRRADRSITTRRFSFAKTDRPAACTARCTWCRSASTCRSSGCCSSPRRSSRRSRISRPARSRSLLPVGGHLISTAICYEIVYPNLVRQFVLRRQRAADDDHQRRVVRTRRRPRTSISRRPRCAPSRTGAIWSAPPTPASAASSIRTGGSSLGRTIYEPAVLVGDARFLQTTTLYTRVGDVVAYASVVVTARARRARDGGTGGLQTWAWPGLADAAEPEPRARSLNADC